MSTTTPTFRNEYGQRYTKQLFWECQQGMANELCVIKPMYTLHRPRPGLISFRDVYVECNDPTGYAVAQRLLEDYSHWQALLKCKWFVEAKEIWDVELDAKLKSQGIEAIKMIADGIEGVSPAVQLAAAKYLADKAYRKEPVTKSPRGRPSAVEVAGKLKQEADDTADVANDLARIRLVK